jgi:hypothetical protein
MRYPITVYHCEEGGFAEFEGEIQERWRYVVKNEKLYEAKSGHKLVWYDPLPVTPGKPVLDIMDSYMHVRNFGG